MEIGRYFMRKNKSFIVMKIPILAMRGRDLVLRYYHIMSTRHLVYRTYNPCRRLPCCALVDQLLVLYTVYIGATHPVAPKDYHRHRHGVCHNMHVFFKSSLRPVDKASARGESFGVPSSISYIWPLLAQTTRHTQYGAYSLAQ